MPTNFPESRRLLEQVMAGNPVGEQLWMNARRELDTFDPIVDSRAVIAAENPNSVEVNPAIAAQHLCEIFFVLERYLAQGRADKYYLSMNSEDADRIIAAKTFIMNNKLIPKTRDVPNRRITKR